MNSYISRRAEQLNRSEGTLNDEDGDLSLDLASVKQKVRELAVLKRQSRVLSTRQSEISALLRGLADLAGVPDEKGHKVLDLGESIEGIGKLVLQRRVSRPLDADVAETILQSIVTDEDFGRTLWNDCVEMVPMLDEDKVMAAHYDGLLTEEQIDLMFPVSESWAFTTPA
jgi:hypothetical protein